jgi:hypothetical protein
LGLPEWLLPIGLVDDDRGDLICLAINGADTGKVYYWTFPHDDPDGSNAFAPVAGSFDEFLSGLHYPVSAQPWHELIVDGDSDGLRRWLDEGGDANAQDDYGNQPIEVALSEGQSAIVELLVERGARGAEQVRKYGDATDVRQLVELSKTSAVHDAFQQAVKAGDVSAAKTLLTQGVTAGEIQQAFTVRGIWYDMELPEVLLEAGADPNYRFPGGETPLHFAASYGKPDAVQWLLEHGARPCLENKQGETALHQAVRARHVETVKRLLDAGEDLNAKPTRPVRPRSILSRLSDLVAPAQRSTTAFRLMASTWDWEKRKAIEAYVAERGKPRP